MVLPHQRAPLKSRHNMGYVGVNVKEELVQLRKIRHTIAIAAIGNPRFFGLSGYRSDCRVFDRHGALVESTSLSRDAQLRAGGSSIEKTSRDSST